MQNKKLIPIGIGILNFLGFGVAYFLMKKRIRGIAGLIVSLGLLAGGILAYIFITPTILFLALPIPWLLLIAVDGWNQARKETFESGFLASRAWFPLALGLLLIAAYTLGGFSYLNGAQSAFDAGMASYTAADCPAAVEQFKRVTGIYRFAHGNSNRLAAEKTEECQPLVLAQRVLDEGEYVQAVSFIKSYLSAHPDSPIVQRVFDRGAEVYVQWAADLSADSQYEQAIVKYLEIEPNFPQASIVSSVPQEIAVLYLEWGDTFLENGDFETAVQKYMLALERDPDLSSALQIDQKIAGTHLDYASSLREEESFDMALAKYQLILDEYPDTPAAETVQEEIPNTYLEWGNVLVAHEENADAVEKFEIVLERYPDSSVAADALEAVVEAYIGLGKDLADQGRFNDSVEAYEALLALAQDADTTALAEAGIAETIAALSLDTGSEGQLLIRSVGKMVCDKMPADSPAINAIDESEPGKYFLCLGAPDTFSLSDSLEAQYPGELRFVVQITLNTVELESAPYGDGNFTLIRRRLEWTVTVLLVDTGAVWTSKTFQGNAPPDFPPSHFFPGPTDYLNGAEPSVSEVLFWLEGIN